MLRGNFGLFNCAFNFNMISLLAFAFQSWYLGFILRFIFNLALGISRRFVYINKNCWFLEPFRLLSIRFQIFLLRFFSWSFLFRGLSLLSSFFTRLCKFQQSPPNLHMEIIEIPANPFWSSCHRTDFFGKLLDCSDFPFSLNDDCWLIQLTM